MCHQKLNAIVFEVFISNKFKRTMMMYTTVNDFQSLRRKKSESKNSNHLKYCVHLQRWYAGFKIVAATRV